MMQFKALRSVKGFENVRFFRPGYAIEYDYSPHSVEANFRNQIGEKPLFAGQINGTTGYEEAASQGLIAGINAVLNIRQQDPFILSRDEAYIGVLIDDLVTKGTEEPYRMFTSRAEYRTLLRQDNADLRLTEKGHELGVVTESRLKVLKEKERQTEDLVSFFKNTSYSFKEANEMLTAAGSAEVKQMTSCSSSCLARKFVLKT